MSEEANQIKDMSDEEVAEFLAVDLSEVSEARAMALADSPQGQPPEPAPPQKSEPKALPEGFNPEEYGLTSGDDAVKLRAELETANQRVKDTQTQYHEGQTVLKNEVSELRNLITQSQQQPPQFQQAPQNQPSSAQLFASYQANPTPEGFTAYQTAVTNEAMKPYLEQFQKQQQESQVSQEVAMQRAQVSVKPEYKDVNWQMMEQNINSQPLHYEEATMVYMARQAGGVQNMLLKAKQDGRSALLAELRQRQASGGGKPLDVLDGSGRNQTKPTQSSQNEYQYGNYDNLTAEQILKKAKEESDHGGLNLL